MVKGNGLTRDKILQAAADIFFEKGFLDSKIDDICDRAGISHGTFYIYFKNKKEVLRELVNRAFNVLYEITEEPWKKGSTYSSLEESIKGFFLMYEKHWKIIRTWKEMCFIDNSFAELWDKLVDQITSRIRKNIESSIKKSLFRNVNPVIAAKALSGMIEHYAYVIFFKNEKENLEEVSKTLADLWYNALNAGQQGKENHRF